MKGLLIDNALITKACASCSELNSGSAPEDAGPLVEKTKKDLSKAYKERIRLTLLL
jgi:hypothetical protein